ncbi:hypothetical protein FAZ19_23305 [Sphingobacterium alkalisoli]|uniref:Uncharacterized protein n=1 Tax=Sphingobacterium alkalisoli TaxID=1874115 RepID=A0A4U0GMJ7_9SPHI|nr:hypothetical protein [Sphingobacterium alkalisoli]TJY60075.1 hypothetical protein FAZ19_23305 [Sphingobacterium alkalisoli]
MTPPLNRFRPLPILRAVAGDPIENLKKPKLINKENRITNAAWLLFGKGNIGYNVHMGRLTPPPL